MKKLHSFFLASSTMIAIMGGAGLAEAYADRVANVEVMITPPPRLVPRQGLQQTFQPGDVGIKPLPEESLHVDKIEGHTKYLSVDKDTTKWVGPDPTWIAVHTKTTKHDGKPDEIKTAIQGVEVTKNAKGGLDFIFSPGVKNKLVDIAKSVKPCGAPKRKRDGGPSCGLREFIERVGEDQELKSTFSEPAADQIWGEVDEGYHGAPGEAPGYEGEGFPDNGPFEEETYYSDTEGWFEGATQGEGEGTLETIVFGTAEEAKAVAAAAASAEGAEAAGVASVAAAGSYMVGSLLASSYNWFRGTSAEKSNTMTMPKNAINRITKPKNKEKDKSKSEDDKDKNKTATSTESKACQAASTMIDCGDDCKPTSTKLASVPSDVALWACSEGKDKDCVCNPPATYVADTINWEQQVMMMGALAEAVKNHGGGDNNKKPDADDKKPDQSLPSFECPGDDLTVMPTEHFEKVFQGFCKKHFKRDEASDDSLLLNIFGNEYKPPKKTEKRSSISNDITGSNTSLVVARAKGLPPDAFDNIYRFALKWKPGSTDSKGAKCEGFDDDNKLCPAVFNNLATIKKCGNNTENHLVRKAQIKIGCGEFSWEVLGGEKEPRMIGERKCYKNYPHTQVVEKEQKEMADLVCRGQIGPSDLWTKEDGRPGVRLSNPAGYRAAFKQWLHYEFSWVEGCNEFANQAIKWPTAPYPGPTCQEVMYDNWKLCNNGGGGGYVQIGCLQYEFHAGPAEMKSKELKTDQG